MSCARCGAPLPFGSSFCGHCRTAHDADLRALARPRSRQGSSERRCPGCTTPLELWRVELAGAAGALDLDRCAACGGLFFDPEELEATLRDGAIAAAEVDHPRLGELLAETNPGADRTVRYVPCPVCGALMHRRAYGARSGVVVDQCRRHGVWLDGGELRRLLHWRRAGGELWDDARRAEAAREAERRERSRKLAEHDRMPRRAAGEVPWWVDLIDLFSLLTRGTGSLLDRW